MAGSVNKVILIGNLGRDPEVRSLNDGSQVVNLSVATSESWKDKASGERRERTEWHRVVIFNENLGNIAKSYLKKGSKVYIEGQLQTRKWTDKEGTEKYSTEVVLQRYRGEITMLDSREGGPGAGVNLFGPGGHIQKPRHPDIGQHNIHRHPHRKHLVAGLVNLFHCRLGRYQRH